MAKSLTGAIEMLYSCMPKFEKQISKQNKKKIEK